MHLILLVFVISDNSGYPVSVTSAPVLGRSVKFRVGSTRVKVKARDVSRNMAKCIFRVHVKGKLTNLIFFRNACMPQKCNAACIVFADLTLPKLTYPLAVVDQSDSFLETVYLRICY